MQTTRLRYPIPVLEKEAVLTNQRRLFGLRHVAVNHHQNLLVPSSLSLVRVTIQSALKIL
jgi:hypothetical protein